MAVYSYLEGQRFRLIMPGWSCWNVHQGRHIRVVYMGIKMWVSHGVWGTLKIVWAGLSVKLRRWKILLLVWLKELLWISVGEIITFRDRGKVTWWAAHADTLPHWSSVVKTLLLIQPSSVSAERAFSILANAFNAQQDRTLEDYLEACVMLQYNNDKRV